jgi:hypothetical protein
MGKAIGLIVGLVLTILGLIGIIVWWPAVAIVIKAGLALAAFLIGLGAIIFGLGELRTPAEVSSPAILSPKTEEKPAESTDKPAPSDE